MNQTIHSSILEEDSITEATWHILTPMNEALLAEWDYEKNGSIDPHEIPDHSNKKFYWKCPKGHPAYLAAVTKRSRGDGCPVCSNHRIIKGINDFESLHPELMDEWMWEENNRQGLFPDTVSQGSGKIAWWSCRTCGNAWQASIVNRARKHSGCPYCANLKVKTGFNDLATVFPIIAEEWDHDKNGDLLPTNIVAYSAKRVWWKCKTCHNSWEASPNQRIKHGCPYCSNHVKIKGFNDLETLCPDLVKEWDFEKNTGVLPSQFAKGSEKKVWWKCKQGHSWKATINSRVRGNGCPFCANKKVLPGYNDLFTSNPELEDEWDFDKNQNLDPQSITSGSTKKAWWICKTCGFSWQASIGSRTGGSGCPVCGRERNTVARLRTMTAKNPLFEQYPQLEKEWDYEKNQGLDTSLIPASSNRLAWWKCEKGHSFRTRIGTRTLHGVGCPYCSNQKVLPGVNDLQTLNPGLADDWDYEKNGDLKPSDVLSHSSKFVWWKCKICGHSWRAKINNRANGRGCPECSQAGTSFIEQTLYYYVKSVIPDAKNRFNYDDTEFDIYLPSTQTAIEYDGSYYHSIAGSKEREQRKDRFCKGRGIRLIRLREKPLNKSDGAINISCDCSNWSKLEETCRQLIAYLAPETKPDISIKRDYTRIVTSKRKLLKERAFGVSHPQLLKEWDYEKNVPLIPDYCSYGSNVKVWWKCKEGHSWQAQISNRCNGSGCPVCFSKRRKQGLHRKKIPSKG